MNHIPALRRKPLGFLGAGLLTVGLLAACGTDLLTIDVMALGTNPGAATGVVDMPVNITSTFASVSSYLDPTQVPAATAPCPTVSNNITGPDIPDPYVVTVDYPAGSSCPDGSGGILTGTLTMTVTGLTAGTTTFDPATFNGTVTLGYTDYAVTSGTATNTFNGDVSLTLDSVTGTASMATNYYTMHEVNTSPATDVTHTLSNMNLTVAGFDPVTGAVGGLTGGFRYDNSVLGYVVVDVSLTTPTTACTGLVGSAGLDAGLVTVGISIPDDGICTPTLSAPGYF
ncbi:MAG: hypothetical protein OEY97_11940 [Nitrospirota bacterium]|nr:hypothetical protein [Nitrospirota bacterium]